MQLGFRQVGRPYPLDALTPLEQQIACHMAQLGLLFTFVAVSNTRKRKVYSPVGAWGNDAVPECVVGGMFMSLCNCKDFGQWLGGAVLQSEGWVRLGKGLGQGARTWEQHGAAC